MLYYFTIIAIKITTNGLKQYKFNYLTLLQVESLGTVHLGSVVCLGQDEGVGRGAFLSGGSEDNLLPSQFRFLAEFGSLGFKD